MNYNTAHKISKLYHGREDIDHISSKEAFTQTIRLIKGGWFDSAWIYTGSSAKPTSIDGLLAVRPNTKQRIYAIFYVDYADEYHIDFVHIGRDRASFVYQQWGIYFDNLADMYKSMYDDYCSQYQDGFIYV